MKLEKKMKRNKVHKKIYFTLTFPWRAAKKKDLIERKDELVKENGKGIKNEKWNKKF